MEKHGFIYIWFDRKHHRFYLGSHWGLEDDGYICSSRWMRKSYRRRPEDFKRRILVTGLASVSETQQEELRWLKMIKTEEIRKGKLSKYYNLAIRANPAPKPTQTSKQKQSETMKKKYASGEIIPSMLGKTHSEKSNEKNRQAHLGKELSDEVRKAFIEAGRKAMENATPEQKQEWYDASSKRFKDIPLAEEHVQKLKVSAVGKHLGDTNGNSKLNEQTVLKIREDNRTLEIIAQEYGLGLSHVARIKSGEAWAHVGGKLEKRGIAKGENQVFAKLDDDKVRLILADSRPQREIAEAFGVCQQVISDIKKNKTWKHIERKEVASSRISNEIKQLIINDERTHSVIARSYGISREYVSKLKRKAKG